MLNITNPTRAKFGLAIRIVIAYAQDRAMLGSNLIAASGPESRGCAKMLGALLPFASSENAINPYAGISKSSKKLVTVNPLQLTSFRHNSISR